MRKRKFLSLFMALALMLSLLPVSALEEGDPSYSLELSAYDESLSLTENTSGSITMKVTVSRNGETLSSLASLDRNGYEYSITSQSYAVAYKSGDDYVPVPEGVVTKGSGAGLTFDLDAENSPFTQAGTYDIQVTADVEGRYTNTDGEETFSTEGLTHAFQLIVVPEITSLTVTVPADFQIDYAVTGQGYVMIPVSIENQDGVDVTSVCRLQVKLGDEDYSGYAFPEPYLEGYAYRYVPYASGSQMDTAAMNIRAAYDPTGYYWSSSETVITSETQSVNVTVTNQQAVADVQVSGDNGTSYYTSLAGAVAAAATGDKVTLLKSADISASGLTIPADKALTLDLNGKELKVASTQAGRIAVKGSLTIQDSTDTAKNGTGTGKIYTETDYTGSATGYGMVAAIGEDALVTLESGYLYAVRPDATDKGQFGLGVDQGGDVTVNGGKIEAGWYAVSGNGNNKTQNSVITINGGELISTADYAVYLPQSGTTNINGGVIYGAAGGVSIQRGTLNISGDVLITSKGTGDTGDWGDGTGGQGCAALNVNARYGDCTVTISGGKLTAENDAVVIAAGTTYDADISITGGTFSSIPAADYIAQDSYVVTIDKDNGSAKDYVVTGSSYQLPADPTKEGYTFRGWSDGSNTYDAKDTVTISGPVTFTAQWGTSSSSGGSAGGSSGGNKTETTTNPDGSTTTTVTKPNGTVTETTTDTAGNKTEVVTNPDGSSQTTVSNKDGSSSSTTVSEDGLVNSQVELSASLVNEAAEAGTAVALPMPAVPVTSDKDAAPVVTVSLSSGSSAKVEIPVADVTPGTVAILVKADGTQEVIKTTVATENGVAVTLEDGDTVKIVDNSKDFQDVTDAYWGSAFVDFATSRGLFAGTSETTFSPDLSMTRAMIVTVLASFNGVDTTTGSTWYEAGQKWAMENGVSDGSGMDSSLTREQLAVMLWRSAGSPQVSGSLSSYDDSGSVSGWAAQAMAWAVENGMISGTDSGDLLPQGQASRVQVATILMRFVECMTK